MTSQRKMMHGDVQPYCYFIRHGETDWNAQRRVQGQVETELNARGRAQAAAMARQLKALEPDISHFTIYASPMKRVRQTLAPILAAYGLDESVVHFDPRLKERSFGVIEGMVWDTLVAKGIDPRADPLSYYHWRPEGGESYADVEERVRAFVTEMKNPAIIVSHGGVHRVMRRVILNLPPEEVATLKVPQDGFCRLTPQKIEWFPAEAANTGD